jgi:ADP-dependent NAD(P)H-hydrate dehydratase
MSATELTRSALRDFPLPAQSDGDKDEHGRLLIVAGSREVPGAALLSARAALRTGAGKIRIATVESVAPSMALHMVEALIVPLSEDEEGGCAAGAVQTIAGQVERMNAIVAGPGMRSGAVSTEIAKILLQSCKPVALDAGLLHCLPQVDAICRKSEVPPILLPHVREMASLLETSEEDIAADRLAAAHRAAQRYGAFVLAKGADSFVAAPDGRCWTYRGGAPGLGIAGSGDVLSGIAGALLARGAEPLTALLWAVLLHGEAGEMLSAKIGPVGFLAREIPEEVPALLAR